MNQSKKIDKSAKILFSVFKENNVDQLGSEVLAILSKISSESQKFKQFLSTKRIELTMKKEILSNIFSDFLNQFQLELVFCLLDSIDFNYSSTALLNLPSKSWEPNDCPLCKKSVPITDWIIDPTIAGKVLIIEI